MASGMSFVKSLLIPLIISLLLYAFIYFFLLPLYRLHRARYAQYLPMSLSSGGIPNTSSLRHRVTEALLAFLPSFRFAEHWTLPARERVVDGMDDLDDDGDEELEEAIWDGDDGRRHALEGRTTLERRRLSRDLEEGFRDSSDEDEEDDEDSDT